MAKFQSDGENEKRTKSKNLNPFFKSQAKMKKKKRKTKIKSVFQCHGQTKNEKWNGNRIPFYKAAEETEK